MPGAGFLKTAKEWRQVVWDASWKPYLWCKKGLVCTRSYILTISAHSDHFDMQETGETLMPNLCGTMLQSVDGQLSKEDEAQLVWAASAVMGGGLDTVRLPCIAQNLLSWTLI